ncbi:hypothetical protein [Nocardia sp. CDC160]|uniref:hypothetical protein n=1 Tax=Nocardia sp. CDC160 TaxID=3112166 RepID=UPI002DBA8A7A|nr:hypothetical protein [Nocardia sp. CDC160]MEC3920678.1 hypothetical protein [Nocardia sp. CDC160]
MSARSRSATEYVARRGDIVGIYLSPPGGAIVLCSSEVQQSEAVVPQMPLVPILIAPAHGILGRGRPGRASSGFLDFLRTAVEPHAGKEIHVVVDNLSTRTTPDARDWLAANRQIRVRFALAGSTQLSEIREWLSVAAEQSIQRGNGELVRSMSDQFLTYIEHPDAHRGPFTWAATSDEFLAAAMLIQSDVRRVIRRNVTAAPQDLNNGLDNAPT